MPATLSNHLKADVLNVYLTSATVKCALMASGFLFDRDAHANWSDVSASELAAGNGYIAGGATLAGLVITEDDVNDRAQAAWNDIVWNASGGDIGPSPGMVLYVDTGTPATSTVLGHLDFGADQTATDGSPFTVSSILLRGT